MKSFLSAALGSVPTEVVEALEREYVELESRFGRGDWGPAQLNGGRLAEALLRYMEWKVLGSFTPLGKSLNRSDIVNRQVKHNTGLPDGIRFHLSSCVELLMDVRNRRDVAHLGEIIDVSEMDAHLVMRLASWSLAEVLREESGLPAGEVQMLIDQLSARRVALVEEINGQMVVVATELEAADRALVVLYDMYPNSMSVASVVSAVKYGNPSRFRKKVLPKLETQGLVHTSGGDCTLTRKGAVWVEKNIELRLHV